MHLEQSQSVGSVGAGESDLLIAVDELKLAKELPVKRTVDCGGDIGQYC